MSLASLVRQCDSKMGLPYSTFYSRFGYSTPEHYDCSGFVWRMCNDNGFPFDASVSWTMQLEAEHKGLTTSKQYAMNNVAIAIHGGDTEAGGGPNGHIAITDGRGGTWEAMGTRYGCRKGTISNRFEYFCRLPGVSTGPSAEQLAALAREIQRRKAIADQIINNRKRHPMWLIRDGRPGEGDIYCFNGVTARLLDGETLKIQVALMQNLGLPTNVYDQQQYLIDRLGEQGLLIGPGGPVKSV